MHQPDDTERVRFTEPLTDGERTAVAISDYLHTLDGLQPLAWHMARGLSERIAAKVNGGESQP